MNIEISQELISNHLKTANSCTIFKGSGIFGGKPIKRMPQTNLLHKKKVKSSKSVNKTSQSHQKSSKYTINSYTKVEVTPSLRVLLDRLFSRNPRCKIFRDLYAEEESTETAPVFGYLYTLDSEFPITDIYACKKLIDVAIISKQKVLLFDEELTCINNDSMIIYNRGYPPTVGSPIRCTRYYLAEYNFIEFPQISRTKTVMHSPVFKPVLTPKRNFN